MGDSRLAQLYRNGLFQEKQDLRIPGPTPVPPAVMRAASRAMVNHRGAGFRETLARVVQGLQKVLQTRSPLVLLTGSGTAGMEAAAANLISPGERVLVLVGGFFGQRWVEVLRAFGAEVEVYEYPWHTGADPEEVARRLRQRPETVAVFMTHNESSTGVLNDVEAISRARREAGSQALLVVDSVSGLGGAPLPMDAWEVDVVVSASQKCLMAPPGLAIVAACERAWERMKASRASRYYLDLWAHRRQLEKGQTPWTPAVSVVFALEQALELLEQEGDEARFARHRLMRDMVRAGLSALGLPLLVESRWASPTVTAVEGPAGADVDELRRTIAAETGVVLSGGQGALAGRIFRVGHMGYATPMDMVSAVAAVEVAMARMGLPVQRGQGVAAAEEVWVQWLR
ncbi:MAG TPA: alanine--glyoxylate aminotransferase family protein [Limnochordales bacterium]